MTPAHAVRARSSSCLRFDLQALEPRRMLAGDMVLHWNHVMADALRADTEFPVPNMVHPHDRDRIDRCLRYRQRVRPSV